MNENSQIKNVLVVWYSQSGQLKQVVNSVLTSLENDPAICLHFEELKPDPAFPFPWSSDEFFQVFPESVKGFPCRLKPFTYDRDIDYDLVVVAWQPWYLSPSIPVHSFFQSDEAGRLLKDTPVITICGARNMWVMGQREINNYIRQKGGKQVGNIVLRDKVHNLVSVITIVRWMLKGKKYNRILPDAGITEKEIVRAAGFGIPIVESLNSMNFNNLQERLIGLEAVVVVPSILMMEKRAKKLFNKWASFILKKGSFGDKSRKGRLSLFKYYLLLVIYLVSPLATLIFYLTLPFMVRTIQREKRTYLQIF